MNLCASYASCQLCPDEVDAAAWLTPNLVRMSVWSEEEVGIDEDTDIPVTLVNKHGGQWRSFVASMRHKTLLSGHAQYSSGSFIFFWVVMMMKNCHLGLGVISNKYCDLALWSPDQAAGTIETSFLTHSTHPDNINMERISTGSRLVVLVLYCS